MATKKRRSNRKQLSLNFSDERIPKLAGMFCVLIALYLFIAFSSYLFTWQTDQDKVLRFSWGLLMQGDLEMSNWLGRLGAIVSNMFFYWGFGLPSYIFVFLLTVLGFGMIRRTPLSQHMPVIRYSFVLLLILSILMAFIFRQSAFPWGGAFGQGISEWLRTFLGSLGMVLLFICLFGMFITWIFNPNFNELTPRKAWFEIKSYFSDLLGGRRPKRRPSTSNAGYGDAPVKSLPALKPTFKKEFEKSGQPANNGNAATDKNKPPARQGAVNNQATSNNPPSVKENQLAFNLDKDKTKREKPKSLNVGETELEITAPEEKPAPKEEDRADPAKLLNQPEKMVIETENRSHTEPYDPTLELSSYEYPVLPLLHDYSDTKVEIDRAELENNKDQIIETLLNYKIEIVKIKATIGPTVTLYEIVPAPGVRISKIKNLEDDIALSLAALGIRIIAPIPGKGTIGIEVPNRNKQIVSLREVLTHEKFKRAKMDLPIALGKTISNEVFVADLAKMPHLLVAGATGQGKSVGINTIIMSLLYKKHPSQLKLVLIDPKKVELFPYARLENHFLAYLPGLDEPIVTDTTKVVHTLNSLTIEMEARYDLLKKAQARNIKEYNNKFVGRRLNPEKGHRFMPFIVLVIDEFADLIMTAGKEVELPIGRLAQLSRAVGIHLIIATQRPSVNIITGVIKANFPARIAYKVTAKVDSRTILDTGGADQLIGRGDMLLSFGSDIIRLQCAFVDTPEVESVIKYISEQKGYPVPFFLPEFHGDDEVHGTSSFKLSELDENFHDAARLVVQNQHGSTSMIQRRLKLGYNRAGRIMDQLEALGIVGPSEGSKAREVLIYDEMELERYLEDLKNRK
ncbi:MAG: DNA translocase FtsK [Bacteroidota bacterium]